MKKIILALVFIVLLNVVIFGLKKTLQAPVEAQTTSGVQSALDRLPDQSAGYVFKDDGSSAEKNGSLSLPAFSVIKLWIAAAALQAAEAGTINLATTEGGKTLDAHVNAMLISSDNASANVLIDTLGFDYINNFIQAGGYGQTVLQRRMLEASSPGRDNKTSANDAATFMFNLVNKKVVSEEASNKIISILEQRTRSRTDPFIPDPPAIARAGFFGKSGTQGDAGPIRNNVGTFVDTSGLRVFFAILVAEAGDSGQAIQLIQSIESAANTGGSAGPGTQTGQTSKVNIIGDSITERASEYIKKSIPTAVIDAKVSRQWDEGVSVLQNLTSSGNLAPVLIFALGTNGAIDDAGVDRVMRLAGNSKVIFTTVYGSSDADQQNSVIRNAISRYPGKVTIADWNATASSHPEWFEADPLGVHPNQEGSQAFAQILTGAVGNTAPGQVSLASCKFYRPDQKLGSSLCVDDGTVCEEGATYKSQYLISIFEEAAQKSGVPAAVLAGVARFESTVPKSVSATGNSYTLNSYSDDDVKAMEEFSKRVTFDNIDETIPGTGKALCPRSPTGALGIVQVQPPIYIINEFEQRNILRLPGEGEAENKRNAQTARGAHSDRGAIIGAKFLGINPADLSLSHYCNPRTALLLGAGVMIAKAEATGTTWNAPKDEAGMEAYIKKMAEGYYGNDANTKQYIDGLWQSVKECKAGATSSSSLSGVVKSNKLCVKVGQPTAPKPADCSTTPGTSTGGGTGGVAKPGEARQGGVDGINISCPLDDGSGYRLICGTAVNVRNGCGHGNPSAYQACNPAYYVCPFGPQLKAAVDVRPPSGNGDNAPVYLPYINGNQSVVWKKVAGPIAIGGGVWGYRHEYETSFNNKTIRLDLTHLNQQTTAAVNSGEQIGTLYPNLDRPGGHLHTAASIDGQWVDSISEGFYCSK